MKSDKERAYNREWMQKHRKQLYAERDQKYLKKVLRDHQKGYRNEVIAQRHGLTVRRVCALLRLSTGRSL